MDLSFPSQFLKQARNLTSRERWENLFKFPHRCPRVTPFLDVFHKEGLISFSIKAFPSRVGTMLTEEGVKLAGKNKSHTAAATDPLYHSLLQKVGKPIFEILR